MTMPRVKSLATLKRMRLAEDRIRNEIRVNMRDPSSHISRGLSTEGWWGGYATAISDVLLMMQSGVLPNDSRTLQIWEDRNDTP